MRKSNHKTPPLAPPLKGDGIMELTDPDLELLIRVVRMAPNNLLKQIIQLVPQKLLIEMVANTPIQGTMQSIPEMLSKLVSLQEKLVGSLKNLEQKKE
jgi:hypothetical protein